MFFYPMTKEYRIAVREVGFNYIVDRPAGRWMTTEKQAVRSGAGWVGKPPNSAGETSWAVAGRHLLI